MNPGPARWHARSRRWRRDSAPEAGSLPSLDVAFTFPSALRCIRAGQWPTREVDETGATVHYVTSKSYLARRQTISSTPAGAFGLVKRISPAVIDVTIRA